MKARLSMTLILIFLASFILLLLFVMGLCGGFGLDNVCANPLISKTKGRELILIGTLQTIILLIGFIIAYFQYYQTLKSEKKRYTYNVTTIVSQESFYKSIEELRINFGADLRNTEIKYQDIASKLSFEERQKFEIILERLLSLYEGIALNINQNLIDEEYAFEFLCHTLTRTYFWSLPYIIELRTKTKNPKIFEHLENVAKRWNQKLINEVHS